jgi:hypothetical protein
MTAPLAAGARPGGTVAFIHRFGSTLNARLRFSSGITPRKRHEPSLQLRFACCHFVVNDGVFAPAPADGTVFHAASDLDANAVA